jgi:hypothetical protein
MRRYFHLAKGSNAALKMSSLPTLTPNTAPPEVAEAIRGIEDEDDGPAFTRWSGWRLDVV